MMTFIIIIFLYNDIFYITRSHSLMSEFRKENVIKYNSQDVWRLRTHQQWNEHDEKNLLWKQDSIDMDLMPFWNWTNTVCLIIHANEYVYITVRSGGQRTHPWDIHPRHDGTWRQSRGTSWSVIVGVECRYHACCLLVIGRPVITGVHQSLESVVISGFC